MPLNYVSVPQRNHARGINQLASEDNIPDGFVEDLLNMDATPDGLLEKRTGYVGHLGGIPLRAVRVERMTGSTNNLCLTFDDDVQENLNLDLGSLPAQPIVLYGRTSTTAGPFTTADTPIARWYPTFSANARQSFLASTALGTVTRLGTAHRSGTQDMLVGVAESLSATSKDNRTLLPAGAAVAGITIKGTTFDVEVQYSNTDATDVPVFTYVKGIPGQGTGYVHTVASASSTTITAATHQLNSNNIMVQVYDDVSADLVQIQPDSVTIDNLTGDVTVTLSEAVATWRVLLYTPPVGQQVAGALAVTGTTTVSFPVADNPFHFVSVYLRSGSTDTLVIPDDVEVDTANATVTVTFQNSGAESYNILYDAVDVRVTQLCVTDSNTGSYQVCDEPEVVVYGLPASEIYPSTSTARDGWLTHIDAYVNTYGETTERTLVVGQGWNFFTEQARTASLRMPLFYPYLRARMASNTVLAPAFYDTTDSPTRTRGYFEFAGGGEGWASIQSITYVSTGLMQVTLSTTGITQTGSPLRTQATHPTSSLWDVLTIQGAELKALDGEWPIASHTVGTDTLAVTIVLEDAHPDLTTGASGVGGVFSDLVPLAAPPAGRVPFLPGDLLSSPVLDDATQLRVLGRVETGNDVLVAGVVEPLSLTANQLVTGTHTGYTFRARNVDGTQIGFSDASLERTPVRTDDLLVVVGDGSSQEYPHPFEIQHVVGEDIALSYYDNGTLTLASAADASRFAIGQWVALGGLGRYGGEAQITEITADGELLMDPAAPLSVSLTGQSIRPCVALPVQITVRDDAFSRNYFAVEGRWVPIETPTIDRTVHDLVPVTRTQALTVSPYGSQPFVRSTTIANNLYLTNGQDAPLRYDGLAYSRAGFPRLQTEAGITLVPTTGGALKLDKTYRYYVRYEALDQNNNVVTLSATGFNDLVVKPTGDSVAYVRVLSFPDLGGEPFEYDRLFVNLYRTKADGTVAYLVERKTVTVGNGDQYVVFADSITDGSLLQTDNLMPSGRQIELSGPIRAKHVTTLGSQLIYANLTSWPSRELLLQRTGAGVFSNLAGKKFRLRKDSTDTGTTTDMVNRVTYEYVITAGASITASSVTGDLVTFTVSGSYAVGDWVYISRTTINLTGEVPTIRGWYMVQAVGVGTITVRDGNAAGYTLESPSPHFQLLVWKASSGKDVPIPLFIDDRNFKTEASALGTTDLTLTSIILRTVTAINASMRAVDRTVSGMTAFRPWLTANGGGDFTAGAITLEQPYYAETAFSFEQVAGSELSGAAGFTLFSEGLAVTTSAKQVAVVNRYPSRIIFSTLQKPEQFPGLDPQDFPETALDVNAADGQEITAIMPFFGTSTTRISNQDAKLVVFKTNSVYFVDLSTGTPTYQLIQTQGLGCTAPHSPAYVQNGIMFANEAGIYKLNMDNSVTPHGQFIDRLWTGTVDKDNLALAHGHNYGVGRKYKLSVPLTASDVPENSQVFVYNYTAESRGQFGSWARYDNHPVTGWCNLQATEYFGSTRGKVCRNRASNTRFDFADGAEQAVSSQALLRTTDFGDHSVRKRLLHLSMAFRAPRFDGLNLSQTGTSVSVAVDQRDEFTSAQLYTSRGRSVATGLDDEPVLKGDTLRYSVSVPKARYFQVKAENATIYEPMALSGVTYRVTGLSTKGTTEAADTTGDDA